MNRTSSSCAPLAVEAGTAQSIAADDAARNDGVQGATVDGNAARDGAGGSAPFASAERQEDAAFTPLLSTYDWNEEWKALQRSRKAADDASYWDKRSATFGTKDAPNPYVDRFLELAGIREDETVFDMGCGTGALTVPLAKAGHRVIAADFSKGMLQMLAGLLADAGGEAAERVRAIQMSWSDDWAARGVNAECVDVALASRSIATADMRDSLMRLTDAARRRVCITLSTGSSPRTDDALLAELGLAARAGRDYLYAFNILANEGLSPEVAYIESRRADTFDTETEAFESFQRMVDSALGACPDEGTAAREHFDSERDAAYARLREWLKAHLIANEEAGKPGCKGVPQGALKVTRPRLVRWAFISWNK